MNSANRSRQIDRLIALLMLLGLALSSSASGPAQVVQTQAEPSPPTSGTSVSGEAIADPSAVYCIDLGYEYQVVGGADSQHGICRFPDGQECDAWAFLQGQCGPEYSYCAQQGYGIETWSDGQDPFSPVYAVCVTEAPEGVGAAVVGSVTDLMGLSERAMGAGCEGGVSSPPPEDAPKDSAEPDLTGSAPASFDWRDYLGSNWMTTVKDQGGCGSCWAFAAVGATEAVHNIAASNPNLDLDLSEQYLVSDCSSSGSCCGGWRSSALSFIRDSGVPDEGCMSYVDGAGCSCSSVCSSACTYSGSGACSDRTCSDRCSGWASQLTTIDDYYYLSGAEAIKEYISTYGPAAVAMRIGYGYWDGDIYRCATDSPANHALVAAGYNDAGGYWIIKNSWGTGWRDGGYFKLGYGECSVEQYACAPYVGLGPVQANLVTNGSFETGPRLPAGWKGKRLTSKDKRVCNQAHSGRCSFRMVGKGKNKFIYQVTSGLSGAAGDTLEFIVWSKAKGATGRRAYQARAIIYYTDGTRKVVRLNFGSGTHGWRRRRLNITAAKPYDKVKIIVKYSKSKGTVWFDDVSLVVTR